MKKYGFRLNRIRRGEICASSNHYKYPHTALAAAKRYLKDERFPKDEVVSLSIRRGKRTSSGSVIVAYHMAVREVLSLKAGTTLNKVLR